MIISLAQNPEIREVVRAVHPKYRKHNVILYDALSLELGGTYWDGGSRWIYDAVNLSTRRVESAAQYAPPQFGGPVNAPRVDIPEGVAIVRTGIFCGKPAVVTVFVNPANMAKLLGKESCATI